jgi:SAM-dependent methyltransferase
MRVEFVEANLDLSDSGIGIALQSQSMDSVLASLFISYIPQPQCLLREIHRVLRPGGRVVLSSLCPDADMSKLYMEGIAELRSGLARELFGREGEAKIEDAARCYLNQASRLLDLEESGRFHFWEVGELEDLLTASGFQHVAAKRGLGHPPQAIVVSGQRA